MKKLFTILSVLIGLNAHSQSMDIFDFNTSSGYNAYSPVIGTGGYLYGTAYSGGSNSYGTIYKIMPDGTNFSVLANLSSETNPSGGLYFDGTYLYGTTFGGGMYSYGAIFRIMPDGSNYAVLYSFSLAKGTHPQAGLYSDGTYLYGTLSAAGPSNQGSVFKILPDGTGFDTVMCFRGNLGNSPQSDITSDGTYLYGTASSGGAHNYGTVFKVKPDGSAYDTVMCFNNINGNTPKGAVIVVGNTLYGTTDVGGAGSFGTVFKVQTDGSNYQQLVAFYNGNDGANPQGSLLYYNNILYGTTQAGGVSGSGTLFQVNTNGANFVTLVNYNSGIGGGSTSVPYTDGTYLYTTTLSYGVNSQGTIVKTPLPPQMELEDVNNVPIVNNNTPPFPGNHTDFGSVSVGVNAINTFTIKNNGPNTLNIGVLTPTGSPNFSLSGGIPSSVAPFSQQNFSVVFNSPSTGFQQATFTIPTDDPVNPNFVLNMQATAITPPQLYVVNNNGMVIYSGNIPSINDSTDFGAINSSQTRSHNFYYKNTGADTLKITNPQLTGANILDFSLAPSTPSNVLPNDSALFIVTFNPTGTGVKTVSVTFNSNDPNYPTFSFNLQGSANTPPQIGLINNNASAIVNNNTPAVGDSTDYGNVILSQAITHIFNVQNIGADTLKINSNVFSGPDATDFYMAGTSPQVVLPSSSTSFSVTFNPATTGIKNATLTISSNDPATPYFALNLQGTAVTAPQAVVTNGVTNIYSTYSPSIPDSTDFGTDTLGKKVIHTFYVKNIGGSTLNITSPPTMGGASPIDFNFLTGIASNIAPGDSASFVLDFDPTNVGNTSAIAFIYTNDPVTPTFSLNVQGTAVTGQSLMVSATTTLTCIGSEIQIPFNTSGSPFWAGNQFIAQLSDPFGSFSSPVNMDTITATTFSGNMVAHIPAGTSLGAKYRVRVVSTNPVIIGNDNGTNITMQQAILPTITSSSALLCSGVADTLTVSITSGGTAPYTYTWSTSSTDNNVTDAVVATASTSYSVTVMDAVGCTGYAYTNLNMGAFDNIVGTISDTGTGNLVSSGWVYIYNQLHTANAAFDSMAFTSGTYSLSGVAPGNYFIKVVADPVLYPGSIPTYFSPHPNVYLCDSAGLAISGCNNGANDSYNVTIIDIAPQTGTGVISGQVVADTSYGHGMRLHSGNNTVMGAPLKGIDVKLGKNPGGGCAARTSTDGIGNYTFNNVDTGSYFIYVDIPNYGMVTTLSVTITPQSLTSNNNNYIVDSNKVYVDTAGSTNGIKQNITSNSVKIYPNPTQGKFVVDVAGNQKHQLQVLDISGKIILQQAVVGNTMVDISNLDNGVYFIQLRNDNAGITTQKIVVQH